MFRTCLFALLALCGLSQAAQARPLVELDIIDRQSDQRLPEYRHHGDTWVAGVPGHEYAVRLRNNSGQRVLVVLSVDGVNAVSGETADTSQAGYVLAPWQTSRISGWRKSLEDVAQFVFTDLSDSYAARTGRADNVGVIGIAVFREARRIRHPRPRLSRASPAADAQSDTAKSRTPRAMAESSAGLAADERIASQRIGTGHGEREWSPVSHTSFMRASRNPTQVSSVRYDNRQRLLAMGVIRHSHHHDAPRAFPGSFVPDPPARH